MTPVSRPRSSGANEQVAIERTIIHTPALQHKINRENGTDQRCENASQGDDSAALSLKAKISYEQTQHNSIVCAQVKSKIKLIQR